MKRNLFFTLIFVLACSVVFLVLNYEKDKKIDNHLHIKTKQYIQNYDVLYQEYKKLSEVIFKTKIDTKEVQFLFKNKDREKLYNHLKDTYHLLQSYNIKQLHFHLQNNDSFLRFHRPEKYGDNLTNIRETVRYVNETKKSIDGFEEGRIYNGYRFVFPLFYEKEHIGSVEVSFSTLAMNLEFMDSYNVISNFLVFKDKVEEKVFQSEKSNYVESMFDKFYIEKKMIEEISKKKFIEIKKQVSDKTKEIMKKEGLSNDSFSIYDDVRKEIITFIKVKNPITKEISGIFTVRSKADYIHNKLSYFYISLYMVILFIAIVIYLIYKEMQYRANIKLNNKKLITIINEADSGIALMGLDGEFLEVNEVYCELLGYTRKELLNLCCLELSSKNTKEKARQVLNDAKEKGKISKVRKECISKNGTLLHLELSLTLLPLKNAFIAVINSLEDKIKLEHLNKNLQIEVDHAVEDLRIKDAMLSQQSKLAAMGEMIDSIAHQWMQPIAVIRMKIQMMELDLDYNQLTNEKIKDVISSSEHQIKHLISTINEFRTFFRPNSKVENISLKSIIDSTILLTQDDLIKNSISTEIIGSEKSIVKVNSSEFKHIIINIINNSKDAFHDNNIDKEHRSIVFYIESIQDKTILKIIDTAGGIPNNIIKYIFEANFTTKKEGKGTGIGLYMTKQIIDKNNASIEVENIAKGACFTITI